MDNYGMDASYGAQAEMKQQTMQTEDPVLIKRKVRNSYGKACFAMILQLLIILAVSIVIASVANAMYTTQLMRETPGLQQAELMQKTQEHAKELAQNSLYLNTLNGVGYLIGNLAAVLISLAALKAFKMKELVSKPRKVQLIGLGIFGILGLQSVSLLIQGLITNITGMTGMNEQISSMMGFSDDMIANVVIFVYFVIVAPVTEELLCRGFVLNALAPVDRRFALIASSVMFGIMHGNFNQMFNGALLGLVLGYLALKSGSVIPAIAAHMLNNFAAVMVGPAITAIAGENADTVTGIWYVLMLVAGLAALIVFVLKNKWIDNDADRMVEYDIAVPEGSKGEYTWKALLTRPTFWIFVVIYVIYAISMVSSVGGAQ